MAKDVCGMSSTGCFLKGVFSYGSRSSFFQRPAFLGNFSPNSLLLGCCLKCVRLGWDAVSVSLVLCLPCLQSCLPTCLPVSQLTLQPGMLCSPPWSCLCRVSGLSPNLPPSLPTCSSAWDAVSTSVVLSLSCLPSGLHSGLVSLVLFFSCLRSCLPCGLPSGLRCCVRALGLSPKCHVRFVQLFGGLRWCNSSIKHVHSQEDIIITFGCCQRSRWTPLKLKLYTWHTPKPQTSMATFFVAWLLGCGAQRQVQ